MQYGMTSKSALFLYIYLEENKVHLYDMTTNSLKFKMDA